MYLKSDIKRSHIDIYIVYIKYRFLTYRGGKMHARVNLQKFWKKLHKRLNNTNGNIDYWKN